MSTFRNDIQGLRTIAVLSVVIFHAFPRLLPGGYIGVDIFFVISGFLIPNSLLTDINRQRFSIAEFYRRRIRRLFPALAVVLAFCIVVGYLVLPPTEYRDLNRSVIATIVFISNAYFWKTTDYFD